MLLHMPLYRGSVGLEPWGDCGTLPTKKPHRELSSQDLGPGVASRGGFFVWGGHSGSIGAQEGSHLLKWSLDLT